MEQEDKAQKAKILMMIKLEEEVIMVGELKGMQTPQGVDKVTETMKVETVWRVNECAKEQLVDQDDREGRGVCAEDLKVANDSTLCSPGDEKVECVVDAIIVQGD